MWLMDEGQACTGVSYRDDGFTQAPTTATRSSARASTAGSPSRSQKAGAMVINETTVTGLLKDEAGKVVGVQTERAGGEIHADAVILADGVNSLVGQRAGLRKDIKPEHVALAVKETLFLPQGDHRAALRRRRRAGRGDRDRRTDHPRHGRHRVPVHEQGFDRDRHRLHAAATCGSSAITPYQLLEGMKRHPAVKPLIAGAEMKEYAAHLIPEGGYKALPKLYGDGWMMVGDSGRVRQRRCTAKARTWR